MGFVGVSWWCCPCGSWSPSRRCHSRLPCRHATSSPCGVWRKIPGRNFVVSCLRIVHGLSLTRRFATGLHAPAQWASLPISLHAAGDRDGKRQCCLQMRQGNVPSSTCASGEVTTGRMNARVSQTPSRILLIIRGCLRDFLIRAVPCRDLLRMHVVWRPLQGDDTLSHPVMNSR